MGNKCRPIDDTMPSIKLLCTVFTLALSYKFSSSYAFTFPTTHQRLCHTNNDITSHRHNLSRLRSKIDDTINNDDNEEENDDDNDIINLRKVRVCIDLLYELCV